MYRLCPLIFFVLCSFNGSAQNIIYSPPVGNYPYSHADIIGRVKNNIIVYNFTWSHTFDVRNSEILVYDDEMRLLNKTSFKSIVPKICSLDFINEGDRFSAVLQYSHRGIFFCYLLSFDSEGNFLKKQVIERSHALNDGLYEVLKSPKDKSVVLIKAVEAPDTRTIVLQYHYLKNELLNHSDNIRLPFDMSSAAFGKGFLDDNNLIVPINDTATGNGSFALFKIDLTNKSSINTIRSLQDAFLVTSSIGINKLENSYIVTAACRSNAVNTGKIFLWRLEEDLSDIGSDTVFNGINDIPCLQSNLYFKISSAALKNNSSNIIAISADEIMIEDIADRYSSAGRYSYSGHRTPGIFGSFYAGRVESIQPSRDLNGNALAQQSNVRAGDQYPSYESPELNRVPASNKIIKVINAKEPAVTIMNVDAQNTLRWTQCFNASSEKDIKYIVDESVFINTQNDLHIIFTKPVNKDNQELNDIRLHPDGTYTTEPVIAMQLQYKYFLVGSFQADSNTLVIPCTIHDKLAFAKLRVK